MTDEQQAAVFIQICDAGFDNHIHWKNWAKKYRDAIDELPIDLRKAVWTAWDNASTKEFSKPVRSSR